MRILSLIYIYIYIYKIEASDSTTIFHISIILYIKLKPLLASQFSTSALFKKNKNTKILIFFYLKPNIKKKKKKKIAPLSNPILCPSSLSIFSPHPRTTISPPLPQLNGSTFSGTTRQLQSPKLLIHPQSDGEATYGISVSKKIAMTIK